MPLIINTNIGALNAQRQLSVNTGNLQKNLERLSSGLRINKAADDAAGLQISENIRTQIRGNAQAISNAQDGTNLLSVAEGSLSVVNDNLQRIRELTVQASNDTNSSTQRTAIKQEIDARVADINRIVKSTQFNGKFLLTGASTASVNIQVGANSLASLNVIDVGSALGSATATTLGLTGLSANAVASNANARAFLVKIDNAISAVGTRRASIGAFQNRFTSTIQNLQVTNENYASSESRIRNVDVASESADLARNQILQQASVSILAQANQTPQLALKLIG